MASTSAFRPAFSPGASRESSGNSRYPPHIAVEELDREDVVVRVVSPPVNPRDGGKLAEEVLAGLRGVDGNAANGNGGPEPA